MLDEESRISENKMLDILQLMEFQEKFSTLQSQIFDAVVAQLKFWSELRRFNCNVQRLLALGGKTIKFKELARQSYVKLMELNKNHIKLLEVYGNFLKEVLNDTSESKTILEK